MSGLMRVRTNAVGGSNSGSSDSRSFLSSLSTSFPPSVRRGTWPLLPNDAAQMKPYPTVLEAFISEPDRMERIRLGAPPIETRSLNIGAALAAANAQAPGANDDGPGQLALVFDDARGAFVGWRPKVKTWGCGADKNPSRPILEQTVRAL